MEADQIVRACETWRDVCGRRFLVTHKVERFSDKAVVTVYRFDRVACRDLLSACEDDSMGAGVRAYDLSTSASEQSVSFFVTRAQTNTGLARSRLMGCPERRHGRIVPPGSVMSADEEACATASAALRAACDTEGDVYVRVRPSSYELAVDGVRSVTAASCRALAPWPEAYVDLENARVVVSVAKLVPDF